jgi:hypothetical protein
MIDNPSKNLNSSKKSLSNLFDSLPRNAGPTSEMRSEFVIEPSLDS